jgi:hypothetical protein
MPADPKQPHIYKDTIERAVHITGDWLDDDAPEGSVDEYLGRLYDQNYTKYEAMVERILEHHRDYFTETLQTNRPAHIDSYDYQMIPERLRQVAAGLSQFEWESMAWMNQMQRNHFLEQAQELQQRRQYDQQMQVEMQQQQAENARMHYEQSTSTMSSKYEQQHYKSLENFAPFDDAKMNTRMHTVLVHGVLNEMSQDAEMAAMQQRALQALADATVMRLSGDYASAAEEERFAGKLADQWNGRFSKLLKEHRSAFEPHFKDSKSWRDYQKELKEKEGR